MRSGVKSIGLLKNLLALKKRITDLYEKGKTYDPEIFNKPIDLEPAKIKTVVEYLQGIDFLETDLDSKGKAFETFLGTYLRGEFGQFFTPRNVVNAAGLAATLSQARRVHRHGERARIGPQAAPTAGGLLRQARQAQGMHIAMLAAATARYSSVAVAGLEKAESCDTVDADWQEAYNAWALTRLDDVRDSRRR